MKYEVHFSPHPAIPCWQVVANGNDGIADVIAECLEKEWAEVIALALDSLNKPPHKRHNKRKA